MSKIGYIRVSTEHQVTARQEELMKELGIEKIFGSSLESVGRKEQKL